MSTYALRGLEADTIQRAKARARAAGTSLDVVLRTFLAGYADGHETPAQQLAAQGGRARAEALTPEERSDAARHAVSARWEKRDATDEEAEAAGRRMMEKHRRLLERLAKT